MATLVLSTVGTVLGGPVGGAIGALIGQSIDQELLAPVSRGPRLGDLSVQTSTYGTQIPRMYGSMRVAGSVIWATDLIENSQTTGAKGGPDVTYSYSVSLAVALSSRRLGKIGRIWADGKLLRGADGDFKVGTTFRFYDGGEDQPIDPLIGSIEGIANTPAYRGLAIAVFENLELADFGNHIPFLTFEAIADDAPPNVAAILVDASGGAIDCSPDRLLGGFAAYGSSIRSAIEPLVASFAIDLFDDGVQLRSPISSVPELLADDELGSSADQRSGPRLQREQAPARALPAAMRLSYYDPDRDYQAGEARAVAGEQAGNEVKQDLAAALSASDAKSLAQAMVARAWAGRDKLTLRLPPRYLELEPGSEVLLALTPNRWTVEKCTIEAFVAVVELRPSFSPSASIAADPGRIVAPIDVVDGNLTLALFDVPDVFEQSLAQPTLLLAASNPTPGWKRRSIELGYGGQSVVVEGARRKSILARTLTILPPGEAYLLDTAATLDVELIDPEQWLTSCDDEALAGGSNLAAVGSELIQFGQASPLGSGRFRLSRLLRGRGGSEWASQSHAAGEFLCLLDRASVQPLVLPGWSSGALVSAEANASTASITMDLNSVRPPAPVNLCAGFDVGGSLALSWTRRSRRGWAWVDEIDVPLAESREMYRVNLSGPASALEIECLEPALSISAPELAPLGSGTALIEVRQIGDCAASRPATTTILLP